MVGGILSMLFGGANPVKQVLEAIAPNAENNAERAYEMQGATLEQFSSEFQHAPKSKWGQFIDGLNRLPRPLMVLSVFGLLIYTPFDPLRMVEVFTAWSLIPSGLWAVAGVIVTFYFGGRAQLKGQEFQKELAQSAVKGQQVMETIGRIREMRSDTPNIAADETPEGQDALTAPIDPLAETGNAAIDDFKRGQ